VIKEGLMIGFGGSFPEENFGEDVPGELRGNRQGGLELPQNQAEELEGRGGEGRGGENVLT
jgi:hypothetical protein